MSTTRRVEKVEEIPSLTGLRAFKVSVDGRELQVFCRVIASENRFYPLVAQAYEAQAPLLVGVEDIDDLTLQIISHVVRDLLERNDGDGGAGDREPRLFKPGPEGLAFELEVPPEELATEAVAEELATVPAGGAADDDIPF